MQARQQAAQQGTPARRRMQQPQQQQQHRVRDDQAKGPGLHADAAGTPAPASTGAADAKPSAATPAHVSTEAAQAEASAAKQCAGSGGGKGSDHRQDEMAQAWQHPVAKQAQMQPAKEVVAPGGRQQRSQSAENGVERQSEQVKGEAVEESAVLAKWSGRREEDMEPNQPRNEPELNGEANSMLGVFDSENEADLEQWIGQLVGRAELIKGTARPLAT